MVGSFEQRVGAVLDLDVCRDLVGRVGVVPFTVGAVRLILGVVPYLLFVGNQRRNAGVVIFKMLIGVLKTAVCHLQAVIADRIL